MEEARVSKQFIKSARDQQDNVVLPTMEAFDSPFDIDEGESNDNSNLLEDAQEPTLEELQASAEQDDIKSKKRDKGDAIEFVESLDTPNATVKGLKPEDLPGRTILMPPSEDGTQVRAKILQIVKDHKDKVGKDVGQMPEMIKFKCLVDNEYKDLIAYNNIVNYIEQDDGWDGTWKFRRILRHEGLLKLYDKRYKGSSYNLLVEWESGEWS